MQRLFTSYDKIKFDQIILNVIGISVDLVSNSSINAWSIAGMLWQHIHA